MQLTIREQETARKQTIKAMRTRLDLTKPDPAQYDTSTNQATHIITQTLLWARAAVPVIALLASIASAIRTVQTVSEIYKDSGSHWLAVGLAAFAFAIAADGAIFVLALAQEGQRLKRIAEGKTRQVTSAWSIIRAAAVRLGIKDPLPYDEMESDSLTPVIAIAFAFIVASNAYIGLRPIVQEIGASSLQDFATAISTATATLQMKFIVDMAGVFFPPFMALAAGHQTARFAAEIAESAQDGRKQYEADLADWRTTWTDPLATEAGQELLTEALDLKLRAKARRKGIDLDETQPVQTVYQEPEPADPFQAKRNRNGADAPAHARS